MEHTGLNTQKFKKEFNLQCTDCTFKQYLQQKSPVSHAFKHLNHFKFTDLIPYIANLAHWSCMLQEHLFGLKCAAS